MKYFLVIIILGILQPHLIAQENQNLQLAKIESGDYSVHKVLKKGYNKYALELAKKKWPIELFKEGELYAKILIKRVGLIEEFYIADLPEYPAYYFSESTNIVVSVIDNKVFYYEWSPTKGADIKYILSKEKPKKYLEEKAKLDSYRKSIKYKQKNAREDRIKVNAAISEKEKQDNSLKGKSIKSIEIKLINPPSNIGLLSIVTIGIKVELNNGTILKTKNLGGKTPYDDFKITAEGGEYLGGEFKISGDSRLIPNDKIELEVCSKYAPDIKSKFTHPINYKNDVFLNFHGKSGEYGVGGVMGKSIHGQHGHNGRNVKLKIYELTANGEQIFRISISDISTGKTITEAKVNIENKISLNVRGGNGGRGARGPYSGNSGGNGGDGGNGGNVIITGDAFSKLKLIIFNEGGNAGLGGDGNESFNSRGINGQRGKEGDLVKK